jgi:hypothetical protein
MQKLFRSLIALGGLAGLVACGDDVSVTEPPPPPLTITGAPVTAISVGAHVQLSASEAATWASSAANVASVDGTGLVTAVGAGTASITATATADVNRNASVTITVTAPAVRSVTVSPSSQTLKTGETFGFVANVDADPGVATTVNWSSSNTAVATVNASGLVTAVSVGSTSIIAASTVTPSVTGAAALTVRAPVAAAINISNITQANTPGSPTVNANNVFGAIDVNMNVDPGEQIVTRAEVLIDGAVACFQNLSLAQSEALSNAAAAADVEAAIVSCQINTAAFNATTGAVSYANGNHTISARAIIQGGTQTATPSGGLIFNNQSGFIAIVSNTNTAGGPASAINPTTGRKWVQGNVTLKLAAVNYAPGGATVTTINASFLGKTFPDTPDAGTQIFTIDFPNSGSSSLNIVGYQTAALGETIPVVTNSNLSTGNPGPTQILNVGAKADTLGLVRLDSTRVDNVAPAAPTVGPFPIWLNAAFTFDSTSAGISNINDTGVDNVTVDFYVIQGANPTPTNCSLTGMTKVTASAGLAETIVSTAFNGKVVITDALGNRICAALGNSFGNDFTPPNNVTLTFSDASTNDFFYNVVSPAVNYILASTGDNASGISPTTPAMVSILRNNSTGNPTCVVGATTACNQVAQAGTANITGGSAGEGYYNLTAQLSDVAGNVAPTPAFTRRYLVDATLPTFTGNVGMNAQYSGNAPAAFTNLLANDNLDLNKLFGVVQYTGAAINLEYPSQSIGSFGLPLEKTFSGTYTIPSLIRCINPANAFAANAANEAQQITFSATDQAGNAGTVAPVAGALLAALDNCGAVGNLPLPAVINTFADSNVVYPGTSKTQVSKSGLTTGANAPTVSLTAIADVSLDNAPEPFTRVEFYFQNAAGNYVLIGQSGPGVLNQTVTNRTWTYKFSWDPDATVPTNAATSVIAIGIDAQGDAVRTAGVVVNVAN